MASTSMPPNTAYATVSPAATPIAVKAVSPATKLVVLAGQWFPRALLLDVNEGHLVLAEAVLDLAEGGTAKQRRESTYQQASSWNSVPLCVM